MLDTETFEKRQVAFESARTLLQPICEAYPPETYRITTGQSSPFSSPPGTTMTPSEQIVNMTITVADWLLDTQ